jgi:hypothetical protein
MKKSFFYSCSFLLAVTSTLPAAAIPPAAVAEKLDSIIVFSPINSSSPKDPLPIKMRLDSKSRSVFFAAFSPAAVQKIINERLAPQKIKNFKNIKFAPYSLSKFDSIIQSELKKNSNARVLYVPDPVQIPFAKKLLIKQGASRSDAQTVSTKIPVVFCPSPSIKATPNTGPLKGQSFIPCSMDFKSVQNMIDKGVATNVQLKAKSPTVVAIPITTFTSLLAKSPDKEVRDLRVLPNPVNIKVIKSLKN